MKKSLRSVLSVALALVMLLTAAAPAFAERGTMSFDYYYVMGDSIPGEIGTDMKKAPGTLGFNEGIYSELVAEHYGIPNGYYGAHEGWRTHEARISINENYDGDEHTLNWEKTWAGDTLQSIQKLRAKNIPAIKKADLITVNLGNNNLIGTLAVSLYKVFGVVTKSEVREEMINEILDTARAMPAEQAVSYLLQTAYELLGDVGVLLETATKDLLAAMDDFRASWDALISDIRALNPDAVIVAIGMYNSLGNVVKVNLDGISPVVCDALEAFGAPVVKYFNSYMQSGSSMTSEYVYADIYGVDLSGSEEGVHLGKAGHEFFAQRIIEAIDTLAPCTHADTVLKNERAATKWLLGYSGDTVCADCGQVLGRGHVTVWHCPHTHTKLSCAISATRFTAGYTGNVICTDCLKVLSWGKILKPLFLK